MQLQLRRSLEQKQGTAHALCTEPRGWANHLSHPSGLTSGHTPTLTQYNEQAHDLPCLPVWGTSNQRKLVCSCSFLLSMGFPFPLPTPSLPWISCLVSSQFLLIKEAKNLLQDYYAKCENWPKFTYHLRKSFLEATSVPLDSRISNSCFRQFLPSP